MNRDKRAPPFFLYVLPAATADSSSAARIAGSQVVGGSALTSSVVIVTPRRALTSSACLGERVQHAVAARAVDVAHVGCDAARAKECCSPRRERPRKHPRCRRYRWRRSISPPTSSARINSAAAASASLRPGISLPPAWPPSPSITMRWLAGAAMCVTRPTSSPSCSR